MEVLTIPKSPEVPRFGNAGNPGLFPENSRSSYIAAGIREPGTHAAPREAIACLEHQALSLEPDHD